MRPAIRPPAVAGSFYPADARHLEAEIRGLLALAESVGLRFSLRFLIVPHAGLVYSGPVAATGYRLLAELQDLRRIVMLGPSHYVGFAGLALPGVDQMETPIGGVVVDGDGVATLRTNPLVIPSPEAHQREHSLEVQLPFLQIVAPGVPVLPLLTGDIDPTVAANVVEPLLGEGTLLLVSSDLSHFHDADTARRLAAASALAIDRLDPGALDRDSACGRGGIQAALQLADRNGFAVETLDLRTSADAAGSADRVVGYGTFATG